jgi:protocatechuate 3,4-dioxygenase beta subunit
MNRTPDHTPDPPPTTEADLTAEVLRRLDATPDARLREVMQALVRHLHGFAREVRLTEAEWVAGVHFLTATGQRCDPSRQEFILLSDTLGLSSLVDHINHAGDDPAATEPTILGPFYVPGAPWRESGASMVTWNDTTGQPARLCGRVLGTDGIPLAGAVLDLWQNDGSGFYAVQQPDVQPADNLRGRYRADDRGRYDVRTVRPVPYPIPADGPVGQLLQVTGRHPWRAAHLHAIVRADGYVPVVTHVFDAASDYLDSDTVFGVKGSLVKRFADQPDGSCLLEHDFVLRPAQSPA